MPTEGTPPTHKFAGPRAWLLSLGALAIAILTIRWLASGDPAGVAGSGEASGDERASVQLRVRAIEGDRALPAAFVRIRDARGDDCDCSGQTGPDGEVELRECPPGKAELWVEAAGFARVTRPITLAAGDNRLEQTLVPGVRLAGRVLDDQGGPLASARISLRLLAAESGEAPEAERDEAEEDEEEAAPDVWRTVTAADGGFVVDTLPPGTFAVAAALAPYESATLPEVAAPAHEPLAIVLQRMATVSGRVLGPSAQPLAAVMVRLAGSGVWPPRSAESDGRGEFRFAAVPPGVYEIRAERAELVSAPLEGVSADPGQEVRVDLSLGPGRVLRGSVRESSSGRLLPGAQITVAEDALSSSERQGQSGPDGSFEFRGLRWLEHLVRVELPGYVSIEARWEPSDAPLRIGLLRAGRIRGRVEDAQGRPVADAELEVTGQTTTGSRLRLQNAAPLLAAGGDGSRLSVSRAPALGALSLDNLGVTQGTVPPIPIVPGSGTGPALGPSPGYRSGVNGEFDLGGIPPGEFRVIARKPGYVASGSGAFELGPGGARDDLRLVLGEGGMLLGRVFDGQRQPVPNVRLSLSAGTEPLRWTLSDEDGSFEFTAVQGRGTLVAQPSSGASRQLEVEIAPGGRQSVDIVLETSAITLRGRVFDTVGNVVAGARVKIETSSAAAHVSTTALTGADGTFEFDGLPPPPYTVRAEHLDYAAAAPVQVADIATPVQLLLDAGEILEGVVVDATTRDPLAGAQLSLRRGAQVEKTRTDQDGRFLFKRVARGGYQLVAEADAHIAQSRSIELTGERRVRPDEEFLLQGAGSLSGEVVDRLGVPVWNAEVAAGEPPDWQRSTRTDHAGHFILPGLRPGSARLSARKPGVAEVELLARVHEGVDSPGVVLRFDEVVREVEAEDEAPAEPTGDSPAAPGAAPRSDARAGGTASPLVLARAGDRVVVERVAPGSAADRLGLRTGDVVTAIDGEPVRSPAQARGMLSLAPGSGGWLIEVRREGTKLQLRYFPGL